MKALLEAEGKRITIDWQTHRLLTLYNKLSVETRSRASTVYEFLIESETEERIHISATNSLASCLTSHDNAFKKWRYSGVGAWRKVG